MRSDSADAVNSGVTVTSKTNYEAGVVGFFDISDKLMIRSGFIYTQRSYTLSTALASGDFTYTYFQIPVGLMYKFSDFGGAFVGPAIAFNASKTCTFGSNCTPTGVQSSIIPIQIGASFKFAPQLGAAFYYEVVPGKLDDNIQNAKAIVADLMITFE